MAIEPSSGPVVPPRAVGLKRIRLAFFYSLAGLRTCFNGGAAFRQECVLAIALIPLVLVLPLNSLSKAVLIAPIFLVLITELLNTAVEIVVDLASPSYHLLAKQAKDVGSAAVLLSFIAFGLVWAMVLLPHLIIWIR